MLSLARLMAWFDASGCAGVVIAGTNGEGPSLSAPTKRDLLRAAVATKGRLKVILGIASNSLEEVIWLGQQAAKTGADATLVMAPGFFRNAAPEAIERWFDAVFETSPLPVLAYNFPARCGFTITPQMVEGWHRFPMFAGLKDSSGSVENLAGYQVDSTRCRFLGDETLLSQALQQGWSGTISGLANVIPQWLVQELHAHPRLPIELLAELRSMPQPAVHKAVLQALGIIETDQVILPLEPATVEQRSRALHLLESALGIRPGTPLILGY